MRTLQRAVYYAAFCAALLLWISSIPPTAEAADLGDLFGTHVSVSLQHPPDLGFTVDRIAFAEAEGECADEFVALLTQNFLHNEVEVVERQKIVRIMEENDFSASGLIRADQAPELGEFLGASALVFVEVVRCTVETGRSSKSYSTKNGRVTTYYSKTTAHFKSSIRVVDTLTGRVHSAKVVEESAEDSNQSQSSYPEYPDGYALKDTALRAGVGKVHRMLLPWWEVVDVRFFKKGKCGMEEAFRLVEIRDFDGALDRALAAVDACKALNKPKPKLLAQALHNAGVVHLVRHEYDAALRLFREAYSVRPKSNMQEGVTTTQKAQRLARNMEAFLASDADRLADGGPRPAGDTRLASVPDGASEAPPGDPEERSAAERLQELQALHDQGLITEEEFESKKEEILSSI